MAKNRYTNRQSIDIFTTIENASDKDASLRELANRYITDEKSIKLHVARKYPQEYGEWFGTDTKKSGKRLTKKEITEKLFEMTDYDESKQEYTRSQMSKSSFPQPFIETIYKQLIYKDMELFDSKMNGIRHQLHETEWLNDDKSLRLILYPPISIVISIVLASFGTFEFLLGSAVFGVLAIVGIRLLMTKVKLDVRALQQLFVDEYSLVIYTDFEMMKHPDYLVKEIEEELWGHMENFHKQPVSTIEQGTGFIGFSNSEISHDYHNYNYLNFMYALPQKAVTMVDWTIPSDKLIWNRKDWNGRYFQYINKKQLEMNDYLYTYSKPKDRNPANLQKLWWDEETEKRMGEVALWEDEVEAE